VEAAAQQPYHGIRHRGIAVEAQPPPTVNANPTVPPPRRLREVRRRSWSSEERLRIVRETLEPGVIVQAVADRHGVSTGQLYTWRKQMLATAMSGFVPVEVVSEIPRLETPTPPTTLDTPGAIEVTLQSGTTIRVTGCVDAAVLRVVLTELGGH
jgi:transposase